MDWLSILCGAILIVSGVVRIFLMQSGKLPARTGIQQYFPHAFIVLGAMILILGFSG
jgi:hypothetical protein